MAKMTGSGGLELLITSGLTPLSLPIDDLEVHCSFVPVRFEGE
jgi:hypothetical protein